MLKWHEEVKASVAQMVDVCDDCGNGRVCSKHIDQIEEIQENESFDVRDYLDDEYIEFLDRNRGKAPLEPTAWVHSWRVGDTEHKQAELERGTAQVEEHHQPLFTAGQIRDRLKAITESYGVQVEEVPCVQEIIDELEEFAEGESE